MSQFESSMTAISRPRRMAMPATRRRHGTCDVAWPRSWSEVCRPCQDRGRDGAARGGQTAGPPAKRSASPPESQSAPVEAAKIARKRTTRVVKIVQKTPT
jgi:hypothetical protein